LIDNITTLQYTQYQILPLYSLAAFRRSIRITWPKLLWGRFKFLKQTAVTFLTSAPPNPASLVTGDYIGSRDHSSSSPLPSALKNRQTHFFDNMFKLAFLLCTRRLNCLVIDHELEVLVIDSMNSSPYSLSLIWRVLLNTLISIYRFHG
jgi:hypothetical protein